MRTRATLLHLSPAEAATTGNHLVISLVGEDTGTERPPIGVVPVVDRSGSMAMANKLGVVTGALGYLSSYLSEDDHLALVAFDNNAETLLPASTADPVGVSAFAEALAAVHPRAMTNLADGIRHGLAAAAAMPPDVLARVIVLTDGQANVGDTDRATLLGLVSDIPSHVSVSFLGVGTDCDHDLLGALAAAGRGSYGFIESADRSADVLGAEIGGLLETEVHSVSVTVRARRSYLRLAGVLGMPTSPSAGDDADEVRIEVGQLMVGQTRHLVLPVQLMGPKRKHARPVTVADVTITGVIDDTGIEVELLPKAHFGAEPSAIDVEVATAVELAQVADAQARAEAAAAAGDFGGAQSLFAGLDVRSGAALGMARSLSSNYASASVYNASATMRSSSTHALRGSLAGSGQEFDALAARTIGSYTTDGQRDVASATVAAAAPPAATASPLDGSPRAGVSPSFASALVAPALAGPRGVAPRGLSNLWPDLGTGMPGETVSLLWSATRPDEIGEREGVHVDGASDGAEDRAEDRAEGRLGGRGAR